MRGLILAAVSVFALGIGGASAANTHGSGAHAMKPSAKTMQWSKSSKFSRTRSGRTASLHRITQKRGRVVKEAQMMLKRQRLYRGPIDGIVGPLTRQALARFQKRNGLKVTASLSRSTMTTLMHRRGAVGVGSTMPSQMRHRFGGTKGHKSSQGMTGNSGGSLNATGTGNAGSGAGGTGTGMNNNTSNMNNPGTNPNNAGANPNDSGLNTNPSTPKTK